MANLFPYIVVEGIHDAQFLLRLLEFDSFEVTKQVGDVHEFWQALIPKTYPHNRDLLARVPVPFFATNGNVSISIQCAEGIANITRIVKGTLATLEAEAKTPTAIGIFLDADAKEEPSRRYRNLTHKAASQLAEFGIVLPDKPGTVLDAKTTRVGGYVLPDNSTSGTLEDVLLMCADIEYASIAAAARAYVSTVNDDRLSYRDLPDLSKPQVEHKAIVSSIASVLKPGSAIQVSIRRNQWLTDRTLKLPVVASLRQFLRDLIQY